LSWIKKSSSTDIFSHLYLALKLRKELLSKNKRVIVIAGPTGVGKTALSIRIAKILGGEIVSADSMQVYRGMDIGTAKVGEKEKEKIPHHMIDICDISENFNVVDFYNRAISSINDILIRKKVPIVVGGSGFYINALLYGPPEGPPADLEIRKKLEKEMKKMGVDVLYERLQMMDPEYAATIEENDRYKIIRALEIMYITKKRVSSFKRKKETFENFDFRCWFLYMEREKLYSKVDKRCLDMIEKGFIEEVEKLEEKGIEKNISASQSIGYRQCLDFLKTSRSKEEKEKFIEEFKKASRRYVKRQFTWFKKEPLFRWLEISNDLERTMEFILQDYEQGD
jgi:tRNA dimethylallyltransferase